MSKLSQIDKAIASLQGEINVLEAAVNKLREQQQVAKPARRPKPRAVPAKDEKVSS